MLHDDSTAEACGVLRDVIRDPVAAKVRYCVKQEDAAVVLYKKIGHVMPPSGGSTGLDAVGSNTKSPLAQALRRLALFGPHRLIAQAPTRLRLSGWGGVVLTAYSECYVPLSVGDHASDGKIKCKKRDRQPTTSKLASRLCRIA